MKKHIKAYLTTALAIGAAIIFVIYPFMCTDLHMKIYLGEDSAFTQCNLYYTTVDSPDFGDDKLIFGVETEEYIDVIIPREYCGKLAMLRLDFTHAENLISINRIELCSGGFIQKSFDGAEFFQDSNVMHTNHISSVQNILLGTYIKTEGNDPFIIFQQSVVDVYNHAFSHYTVTKLFICLFVAGAVLLAKTKLFSTEE